MGGGRGDAYGGRGLGSSLGGGGPIGLVIDGVVALMSKGKGSNRYDVRQDQQT